MKTSLSIPSLFVLLSFQHANSMTTNWLIKEVLEKEVETVLTELVVAERNCNIILAAARGARVNTLLEHFTGGFDISPVEGVVKNLKLILSSRRRVIETSLVDPILKRTTPEHFSCLCPLTVFLKCISRAFSSIKVRGNERKAWGAVEYLQAVLLQMESRLESLPLPLAPSKKQKKKPKNVPLYWPGIAQCIMLHEECSIYTVTSSPPRYASDPGLGNFGYEVRSGEIRRMTSRCSPELIARIERLEALSESLATWRNTEKVDRGEEWHKWQNPFEKPENREKIRGTGATFRPNGAYMAACLLDYWRFQFQKPLAAQDRETAWLMTNRNAFAESSCAEWELFVTQLSTPAPKPYKEPVPVHKWDGMPKSDTWERKAPKREEPKKKKTWWR
ncbi:hypothetical protein BGZ63DRAFT_387321 [Mariannaea sp. PMI_226]|nr:hypothetical protein BGZ63DRAFT_387321 [Mariannaea sp. PMI_226]